MIYTPTKIYPRRGERCVRCTKGYALIGSNMCGVCKANHDMGRVFKQNVHENKKIEAFTTDTFGK